MRYKIEELENEDIIFGYDVQAKVQKIFDLYFVVYENPIISDTLYLPGSILYCKIKERK